jgi:regulator of replication initiation timing
MDTVRKLEQAERDLRDVRVTLMEVLAENRRLKQELEKLRETMGGGG